MPQSDPVFVQRMTNINLSMSVKSQTRIAETRDKLGFLAIIEHRLLQKHRFDAGEADWRREGLERTGGDGRYEKKIGHRTTLPCSVFTK